eukprot:jgi/Hompol1/1812/HPOL_005726-RA
MHAAVIPSVLLLVALITSAVYLAVIKPNILFPYDGYSYCALNVDPNLPDSPKNTSCNVPVAAGAIDIVGCVLLIALYALTFLKPDLVAPKTLGLVKALVAAFTGIFSLVGAIVIILGFNKSCDGIKALGIDSFTCDFAYHQIGLTSANHAEGSIPMIYAGTAMGAIAGVVFLCLAFLGVSEFLKAQKESKATVAEVAADEKKAQMV